MEREWTNLIVGQSLRKKKQKKKEKTKWLISHGGKDWSVALEPIGHVLFCKLYACYRNFQRLPQCSEHEAINNFICDEKRFSLSVRSLERCSRCYLVVWCSPEAIQTCPKPSNRDFWLLSPLRVIAFAIAAGIFAVSCHFAEVEALPGSLTETLRRAIFPLSQLRLTAERDFHVRLRGTLFSTWKIEGKSVGWPKRPETVIFVRRVFVCCLLHSNFF